VRDGSRNFNRCRFGIVVFDRRSRRDRRGRDDRLGLGGGFDNGLGLRLRHDLRLLDCSGFLNDQLDGYFITHAFGLRREWMRKRRGLDRLGHRALFTELATTIAREDLLGEGFDRVDRQNCRRHIVATVSREDVRSFTGPHDEPFSPDTFKRRTERRHQTHSSASCSVSTSSN
jgi:hypothetical protein